MKRSVHKTIYGVIQLCLLTTIASVSHAHSDNFFQPDHNNKTHYIAVGGKYANTPPLLAIATGSPESEWKALDLSHIFPLGILSKISCHDQICVTTGIYADNETMHYKILYSQDSGQSWKASQLDGYNNNKGVVRHLRCAGKLNNSLCIAITLDRDTNKFHPMISIDDGQTWQTANIPHGNDLKYKGLDCFGDNDHYGCMVVTHQLIYRIMNNINIWQPVNDTQDKYESINCTGSSFDKTLCLVYAKNKYWKGFKITKDCGDTWRNFEGPDPRLLDCTGEKGNIVCTNISGGNHINTTMDYKGTVWKVISMKTSNKTFINIETLGLSCTGLPPKSFCVSVGTDELNGYYLITDEYNGTQWRENEIPLGNTDNTYLASVKCEGDQYDGHCIVGGGGHSKNNPYILSISMDSGKHWNIRKISNIEKYSQVNTTIWALEITK